MKTSKKLIAVLLAVVMCFSAVGSVFAMAAANEDAQAAADAYNAKERDFSKTFGNVSVATATKSADTLNASLIDVFDALKVNELIYSDSLAATLVNLLNGLMKKTSIGDAVGENGKKVLQEKYPQAYEYLFVTLGSGKQWRDVDKSQLKFGIEPGNKEQFVEVLTASTSNIVSLVSMALFFESAGLYQTKLYNDVLVTLLEILRVPQDKIPTSFMDFVNDGRYNPGTADASGVAKWLFGNICDAVENILADPVPMLTEILPDLAQNWDGVVAAIKRDVREALSTLVDPDKVNIPALSDLPGILGDKLGLKLDPIDAEYLALMGKAEVVKSSTEGGFRMQVNGDKATVFMALIDYLMRTLQKPENQAVIGKLLSDNINMIDEGTATGLVGLLLKNLDKKTVAEILAKIDENLVGNLVTAAQNGNTLDLLEAVTAGVTDIAEVLEKETGANTLKGKFAGYLARFVGFINSIFGLFQALRDCLAAWGFAA